MKSTKKKKKKILPMTIIFIILDLCAAICFFIMYGPWNKVRNLLVNTAMTTFEHQYLAKIFYSDDTISKIVNSNYFVALNEDANVDDIVINTKEKTKYKNEYEKELLTRDPDNDLYKVINIKVGNANGRIVAIYDPTKVQLIHTKKFNIGGYGERIITMCERYGGVVCINAGGFIDNGMGSDIPIGFVIKNHELIWIPIGENKETYRNNVIGITDDGKLKLMTDVTVKEALDAGVKDAIYFNPFLIVNGKSLEIVGDPWGVAPRMAIAQRKDGVMLFLSIDGENYINGASLQNVVDILKQYGAYNAANLDGGTSSTMIVNGKLINTPAGGARKTNGRYVVTGWGLIP